MSLMYTGKKERTLDAFWQGESSDFTVRTPNKVSCVSYVSFSFSPFVSFVLAFYSIAKTVSLLSLNLSSSNGTLVKLTGRS